MINNLDNVVAVIGDGAMKNTGVLQQRGQSAARMAALREIVINLLFVAYGGVISGSYFECFHEVKLIVDLIYEVGIANMNYSISNTVEYGEYVSGPKIINKEETKKRMKEVLEDIQSGKFTKQWMDECKNGQKNFLKTREELAKHSIETVGTKLRAMMPWIGKKKLVDSDKK